MKDIRSELIGSLLKRPNMIPEIYPLMGFTDPLESHLSEVLPILVKLYESKSPVGVSSVIKSLASSDSPINSSAWEQILYSAMDSVKIPSKAIAYIDEIRESLIVGKIQGAVNRIKLTEGGAHTSAEELMDTLESTVKWCRAFVLSDDRTDMVDAEDEIEAEIAAYAASGEIPLIATGICLTIDGPSE